MGLCCHCWMKNCSAIIFIQITRYNVNKTKEGLYEKLANFRIFCISDDRYYICEWMHKHRTYWYNLTELNTH